jgi:hypothetical protein
MTIKLRRSRLSAGRRGLWQRVAFAALPLAALAMILLPQQQVNRIRVWLSPAFSPFHPEGVLDLSGSFGPTAASAGNDEGDLRAQVLTYQNALAEMAATLDQSDRRVRELSQIRKGLAGLPCRLTPARFMAPEIAGGRAVGRLDGGTEKAIRKSGAVIIRSIDRGTREAIEHGNPVLLASGLVGIVDEVGPLVSTVRLTTDPGIHIMVQVVTLRNGQWRAGPEGVAIGSEDGRSLIVQGMARSSDVQNGDFIVTSTSPESSLPPYLVVGRVTLSEVKPTELFSTIVVAPRVPAAEVRDVYVLSPEPGESKRAK